MTANKPNGNDSTSTFTFFKTKRVGFEHCKQFLNFCNNDAVKHRASPDSVLNIEQTDLSSVKWCRLVGSDESFPEQIDYSLEDIGQVVDINLNKVEKFYQLSFVIKHINPGREKPYSYKEGDEVKEKVEIIENKYALYDKEDSETNSRASHLFLYIPNFDCYWVFSTNKRYLLIGTTPIKMF
jgi:hypothetical protein